MGSRSSLCCALVAALAVTASASQGRLVESDQQVLVKLERSWNEAVYRNDVALIESILADEFTATYDDGSRGDKAKELALVAEFNQQVESASQDEFTVRVYRDTAVVRFALRLVGTKQGQRSELRLRYTDVWVMRDGRWLCVSSQSTRVQARPLLTQHERQSRGAARPNPLCRPEPYETPITYSELAVFDSREIVYRMSTVAPCVGQVGDPPLAHRWEAPSGAAAVFRATLSAPEFEQLEIFLDRADVRGIQSFMNAGAWVISKSRSPVPPLLRISRWFL